MGWFRSKRAPWAVRLALFAVFLRALTPSAPAVALGGEHGEAAWGVTMCAAYATAQAHDNNGNLDHHGASRDCPMCAACPIAAAAVLATLAADVLAPDQLLQALESAPQDALLPEYSPKTNLARAPPAPQAA